MPVVAGPRRVLRSRMVKWLPSEVPWMKLNTDGAFDGDLQRAAGGGLMCDHTGSLILAFCMPLVASSIFDAELQALLQGLRLALQRATHVWVELYALAIYNLLQIDRFGPVQTRHTVAAIKELLRGVQF